MDGTSQFRTSRAMLITAIVVFMVLVGLLLLPGSPARSPAPQRAAELSQRRGVNARPSAVNSAADPGAEPDSEPFSESPRGIQLTSRSEVLQPSEARFADRETASTSARRGTSPEITDSFNGTAGFNATVPAETETRPAVGQSLYGNWSGQASSVAPICVEPLTVNPVMVRIEDSAGNSDLRRLCEKMEELISRQRQMSERQSESQENFLRHQNEQAERSRSQQLFALQATQLTAMQERISHLDSIISDLRKEAHTARIAMSAPPAGASNGSVASPFMTHASDRPGQASETLSEDGETSFAAGSAPTVTESLLGPDGTPLCEIIPGRSARSADVSHARRRPARGTLPIRQGREFANQADIGHGSGLPPRERSLTIPVAPTLAVPEEDLTLPDVPLDLTPQAQPSREFEIPTDPATQQPTADQQGAAARSGKVHVAYHHKYRFPAQTARKPETEQSAEPTSPPDQRLLRVNHEGGAGSSPALSSETPAGRPRWPERTRSTERVDAPQIAVPPRSPLESGNSPERGHSSSGVRQAPSSSDRRPDQPAPSTSGTRSRSGPGDLSQRGLNADRSTEQAGNTPILHRLQSAIRFAGRRLTVE